MSTGMNTASLLTDDEVERVVMAFLNGHGPSTEEQMTKAIEWAYGARVDSGLLENVLKGRVFLTLADDGTLLFTTKQRVDADRARAGEAT